MQEFGCSSPPGTSPRAALLLLWNNFDPSELPSESTPGSTVVRGTFVRGVQMTLVKYLRVEAIFFRIGVKI